MKVFGITGSLGAGKGAVVDYLKEKGFKHFSASGFIVEEIERRGMEVNRKSMNIVGNDLRRKNSPSFVVNELYKKAAKGKKDCIIESIHTLGEVNSLKEKANFCLLAVDADPKIRYDRILLRKSSKDSVTFEEFMAHEKKEMNAVDEYEHNLSKCIEKADHVLMNDGSFEDLRKKIDEVIDREVELNKPSLEID